MIKKILFYILWLPIGLILIALAVSNRAPVTLNFDPIGSFNLPALEMPLYLLLFLFLIIGVFIGGMMTWLKQGKWRSRAKMLEKENTAVTRDMQRVKLERAALSAPQDKPII